MLTGLVIDRYFLAQGYSVLFLYRESTKRPVRSYIESQLSDALEEGIPSAHSLSCIHDSLC